MHKLPAVVKLPGLLALSSAVFFFGVYALAAASLFLVFLSLLAEIRPWELLRGIRSLAAALFLVLFSRALRLNPLSLDPAEAAGAMVFIWGVVLSFSAGALLFSVTTMTELMESVTVLENALRGPPVFFLKKIPALHGLARRLERPWFGIAVALTLGFLPRFFEVWETALLAWRARAGKRGIRAMLVLVPLTVERMLEAASETAAAMEGRGLQL
jgi:energy-coupling factor transporter transmembrane protein EcfT